MNHITPRHVKGGLILLEMSAIIWQNRNFFKTFNVILNTKSEIDPNVWFEIKSSLN